MLDRLIKVSSLGGALIVFCGVLKLIIYYSAFNINIIDFISFSEIITSFLDDLNILIAFFAVMLLHTIPTTSFLQKRSGLNEKDFHKVFSNALYSKRKIIKWVLLIPNAVILALLLSKLIAYNYVLIYLTTLFTMQLLSYFNLTVQKNGEIDLSDFGAVVTILVSVILSIFLFAQRDIEQTKSSTREITIETNNSILKCDSDTDWIFLGKTEAYVFLYNKVQNSTTVLPISNIERFQFE